MQVMRPDHILEVLLRAVDYLDYANVRELYTEIVRHLFTHCIGVKQEPADAVPLSKSQLVLVYHALDRIPPNSKRWPAYQLIDHSTQRLHKILEQLIKSDATYIPHVKPAWQKEMDPFSFDDLPVLRAEPSAETAPVEALNQEVAEAEIIDDTATDTETDEIDLEETRSDAYDFNFDEPEQEDAAPIETVTSAPRIKLKYEVFLSYSHEDERFSLMLQEKLRNAFLRVYENHSMRFGTSEWHESVSDAIQHSLVVLVLCSASAKASEWVNTELNIARQLNRQIVPLHIADSEEDAIPDYLLGITRADMRDTQKQRRHLEILIRGLVSKRKQIRLRTLRRKNDESV